MIRCRIREDVVAGDGLPLVLIAGPDVVRLAPALIVSDAQIAEANRIMRAAVAEFLADAIDEPAAPRKEAPVPAPDAA